MSGKFLTGFSMNDNIVHKNYYLPFADHSSEGFIHIPLESGGSISLSKEHNEGFKNSSGSDKRCLPLITGFDTNIGESPSYVKLGKV